MEKQTFTTVTTPQATGDEPSIIISTIALDREGDEIVPEGGDFSAYRRNPCVLFGHAYDALPVGTTTRIHVERGRGIRASWRWLEGDEFAARVRNAFEQGVLRAASVGFRPRASEPNGMGGRRFTSWELLEWSLCAVPANPEAVRTLKSLDLWRDDAPVLYVRDDDAEPVATAADLLEALREQLPALVAGAVGHALRHRSTADPLRDPFVSRHQRMQVTEAAVLATLPAVIRDSLREVVAAEIASALSRSTGRVN